MIQNEIINSIAGSSGGHTGGKEIDDHLQKKPDNGPPRKFSAEELAPQIMIRKAKKVSFPSKM